MGKHPRTLEKEAHKRRPLSENNPQGGRATRRMIVLDTNIIISYIQDEADIVKWIASVLTVNIDLSLAREAGRIRRELRVNTVDSIIAATAVLLNCPIATRDLDFKKIRDVKVIVP